MRLDVARPSTLTVLAVAVGRGVNEILISSPDLLHRLQAPAAPDFSRPLE